MPLSGSNSVYIELPPREGAKEKKIDRKRINFQTTPSAPFAGVVGWCDGAG